MYLHLGLNVVVPEADVIGIFDLDNTTGSHITRKFLSDAERSGRVVSVSDDLPKSFVLCSEYRCARSVASCGVGLSGGGRAIRGADAMVYLSQISSQTLLKRSESNAVCGALNES